MTFAGGGLRLSHAAIAVRNERSLSCQLATSADGVVGTGAATAISGLLLEEGADRLAVDAKADHA